MNVNNCIEKDDLTEAARLSECLTTILGDMVQEYFDDGSTATADGLAMIAWDFRRYRAYANASLEIAHKLEQELHSHGIYCYSD